MKPFCEGNEDVVIVLKQEQLTAVSSLLSLWDDPPRPPFYWPDGRPAGFDEVLEQVEDAETRESPNYELRLHEESLRAFALFLELAQRQVSKVELEAVTGHPALAFSNLVKSVREESKVRNARDVTNGGVNG